MVRVRQRLAEGEETGPRPLLEQPSQGAEGGDQEEVPCELQQDRRISRGLASFQAEFVKIAKQWDKENNRNSDQGHWRKLPPGQKGHDQHGNKQQGRTWVRQNRLKSSVKLKTHQADFAKTVLENPTKGHIAAHGTGTGKTISAIATFEKLKGEGKAKRVLVVAPAGLRENFHGSVEKFTNSKSVIVSNAKAPVDDSVEYVVTSYAAFRRDPQSFIDAYGPDTIIADEFHRAGIPTAPRTRPSPWPASRSRTSSA